MKTIYIAVLLACCASCVVASEPEPAFNDMMAPDIDTLGGSAVFTQPDVPIVASTTMYSGPCASDGSCSDGNPCTADSCINGKCSHTNGAYLGACMLDGAYGFCSSGSCCVGCLDSDSHECVSKCPGGEACTIQHICQ